MLVPVPLSSAWYCIKRCRGTDGESARDDHKYTPPDLGDHRVLYQIMGVVVLGHAARHHQQVLHSTSVSLVMHSRVLMGTTRDIPYRHTTT